MCLCVHGWEYMSIELMMIGENWHSVGAGQACAARPVQSCFFRRLFKVAHFSRTSLIGPYFLCVVALLFFRIHPNFFIRILPLKRLWIIIALEFYHELMSSSRLWGFYCYFVRPGILNHYIQRPNCIQITVIHSFIHSFIYFLFYRPVYSLICRAIDWPSPPWSMVTTVSTFSSRPSQGWVRSPIPGSNTFRTATTLMVSHMAWFRATFLTFDWFTLFVSLTALTWFRPSLLFHVSSRVRSLDFLIVCVICFDTTLLWIGGFTTLVGSVIMAAYFWCVLFILLIPFFVACQILTHANYFNNE